MITDEKLFLLFNGLKEIPKGENRISKKVLLTLISMVPVFAPEMMYEAFDYATPYNKVRAYLSQLANEKLIARFQIKKTDSRIRTIYYATEAGYNRAREAFPGFSFPNYLSQKGRKLSCVGMHDLGIGICVIAHLVASAYNRAEYNKDGSKYNVFIEMYRRDNAATCYIEFDSGAESPEKQMEKIGECFPRGLSGCNRAKVLIFAFRRESPNLPKCFSRTYIKKLLDEMLPDEDIFGYCRRNRNHYGDNFPASFFEDFGTYTTIFKEGVGLCKASGISEEHHR